MKVILLNTKSSERDLYTYGKGLLGKLQASYSVSMYTEINENFSNIIELHDDDEKLLLFNHFCLPDGFSKLSQQLPKFKNVKFILSPYSSYAGLDLNLLKQMGIKYRNNGGANAKSVAQYAIASMFSLLSRFPELSKSDGIPDGSILGEEYHNKTAGIIGMGNVGICLYEILSKLGLETTYYNRTEKKLPAKKVELNEVFNQDIVFITIANNSDTKSLLSNINSLIKEENYIIDISAYDDLYDKQAVVDMLNHGKLKGYALETNSKFTSEKNLIATPHIAWCTVDAEKRTVENYLNRALTILEGQADSVDFIT